MTQHISDLLARSTAKGNGQSIFRIAASPKIRNPSFGRPHRMADKFHAGRCTCAEGRTLGCPWHLGRHSEPIGPGEEIPRVTGLSNGAWALFLVIWRGIHAMARKSAKESKVYRYSPGRARLARAVGGRNRLTRDRDTATGRFAVKIHWEKGACDPSTVTAYLQELASCVLGETALPMIKVVRRCRYEAEIVMQTELLEPSKPSYRALRVWEVGTDGHGLDPNTFGKPPEAARSSVEGLGIDVPSSFSVPLHRLREGKSMSQHDVGTYNHNGEAELALGVAAGSPWWSSFCRRYSTAAEAGGAMRRIMRLLSAEGVPLTDLSGAFAVATESFLRLGKTPRNWEAWLIDGARRRFRTKEAVRALEPVAAILGGAELAETARQRVAIGHDAPSPSPELVAGGGAPPLPPSPGGGGGDEPTPDDPSRDPELSQHIIAQARERMEAAAREREATARAEADARRAARNARIGVRANPWGDGAK